MSGTSDPAHTARLLEALLFSLGRPLSRDEARTMLDCSEPELEEATAHLREGSRGMVLVEDGRMMELRAAPGAAELLERVRKEEYSREVGKAGLEALAAVLYRGPLSRSGIDFIRGVNSSQTLRTLAMRGLLRRVPNPADARQYLYEPTTELLGALGVSHIKELPEYAEAREKLAKLEQNLRESEAAEEVKTAPQEQ